MSHLQSKKKMVFNSKDLVLIKVLVKKTVMMIDE